MSECKTKRLPPKVENMSKEQLLEFLKKKKECESVAQKIVVNFLETGITEREFVENLPHINQCHYDDITEERAIVKMCGYPVCLNTLPDKLPTQQYKISSRTNRVFDIRARKNFCSNFCYKASLFIKEQLLTSPLWCRELEEIPNFKLMPKGTAGILGDEVDLSIVKKVDVESKKETDFKSLYDFTEASLQEISQDDKAKDLKIDSIEVDKHSEEKVAEMNEKPITDNKTHENTSTNDVKPVVDSSKKGKSKSQKGCSVVGDVIERRAENRIDPIISEGIKMMSDKRLQEKQKVVKETKKKEVLPLTVAIIHIEKCLGEWFTLESLLLLFGEERVKELVTDKGECIKEYLNNMASGLLYRSTSYDQYQQLCRKLNLLELEDRRYDSKTSANKQLKPMPHYYMLQEESKKIDIKVKAFLKGDMEIPQVKTEEIQQDEEEPMPNLPLVDKTAQNALRRKIVLNGFNKVLPDLLQSLGIAVQEINSDLKLLIATFDLQAHNIVFKPSQWNMIAMIVVKLLSIRDVRLRKCLEADRANTHMQLLLMSYDQDGGYLDRVISWLTDVDRLLETNNTQLTMG